MTFREVYDEHFPFVWKSLLRLGVPEASIKDAAQDVFLVVHRRLPDFVARAEVTTWLFRICFHTAKDYRRRAHVRREVQSEAFIELCADPGANALEAAERREGLLLVDAALGDLTLEQRAVFILFELEDMTGEQIAEALGIPLGTVYSRLRLGRAAFRKAIEQHLKRRSRRPPAVGMP